MGRQFWIKTINQYITEKRFLDSTSNTNKLIFLKANFFLFDYPQNVKIIETRF